MHVVLEIRLKIQQHEKAVSRRLDVAQYLLGREHRFLRLVVGIKGLQSFRHRPAKGFELELLADLPDQVDYFRLLVALNNDERRAGADNRRQVPQRTFCGQRSGLRKNHGTKTH